MRYMTKNLKNTNTQVSNQSLSKTGAKDISCCVVVVFFINLKPCYWQMKERREIQIPEAEIHPLFKEIKYTLTELS